MKVLMIGDVIGRPGRHLLSQFLPPLREEEKIEFVVANGENVAGGKGITPETMKELFDAGVNVIVGGNHIWQNREVLSIIDSETRLLRPANYPEDANVPGRGFGVYDIPGKNIRVGVVSLLGRVFMTAVDCPFRVGKKIVRELRKQTPLVFVDIHAEATSEKNALGCHLDGDATAVVGSHTHIPTADERILPGGTAYVTDLGMTGPYDSVIGVKKEIILQHFLSPLPVRHEVATGDPRFHAVLVTCDETTGRATAIRRIQRSS
ncbi:MAG: TIGR00282 family metallophosphoesterase [bacterium]